MRRSERSGADAARRPGRIWDHRDRVWTEEHVLGSRWLRLAYRPPWRGLLGPLLFRTGFWSRLMGFYADSGWSRRHIRTVIRDLGLDTSEFRDGVETYRSFNDFFTRHLRPGSRPYSSDAGAILCPADCRLTVYPSLAGDMCVPVKGCTYSLTALLGPEGQREAEALRGGALMVCRLCPADYHRFHYPASGRVTRTWAIPGRLDSVNPTVLDLGIPVFVENRRCVSLLHLDGVGVCAFVEVGAFGVAGIVQTHACETFQRMDEKGCFRFGGSTIVLVFPAGSIAITPELTAHSAAGTEVRMRVGETVATSRNTGD